MSSISKHFFSYSAELTFWRSKVYNQKAQQSVVICNNLLFAYSPYRTTTLSTHANFLCYLYGLNKHIKKNPSQEVFQCFSTCGLTTIQLLFLLWLFSYQMIRGMLVLVITSSFRLLCIYYDSISQHRAKKNLFLSFLFVTYFLIESALESAPFRVFFAPLHHIFLLFPCKSTCIFCTCVNK